MASKWHKTVQEKMITDYIEKGYSVKKEGKLGFVEKITRENQFKQVDIIAKKGNEIVLVEIEDIIIQGREYGVKYVELGGILFLSYLFAKLNPNKDVKLVLVFKNNIVPFRKNNIERMVSEFKKNYKELQISTMQYRV
jgi:hypothetical protein